jgi:hypothetical protein
MKKFILAFAPAATMLLALAFLFAFAQRAQAAGPFTVNTTNDTHAVTAGTSANDSGGHISVRSAIEAANAQAGATTINVPPGTYNLTFGELDVATNAGKTITILASGGNAANTIINQTNGTDRVFNIDPNSVGSDTVTISGLTIQGGHDKTDIAGGAGILAGSITATPKDVLNLSGCVIANNHCSPPNTNYTAQIGGGVQMAGGDLNITSCTFTNNTAGASLGGAIAFFTQTVASSLNISNSTFANNSMTNTSGSGPDGGGAIFIGSTAGSIHTILNSVFSNNRAIGAFGNTYGGAIEMNTGTLNITNSTFTGNLATSVNASGGQGGAIYVDSGTNNISFCRIVGNTAPNGGGGIYNHGSNGANTFAVNNWWGCIGGPGASGCDVAATDSGGLTASPYIVLTNTASPASILLGQSTTLTANFLQNSAGTALTASQISVLLGLPVTWNNAVLGTLSSPQTTIQANGTATVTFTAGNTSGTGQANATVDNGIATALITINCPNITGAVSGGGTICPGGPAMVTVSVSGGTPPYSITLNNGGGTQVGSSPLDFIVSPANTTIYQVSSGQDVDNCPVAASGSATVILSPSPNAAITPLPASVFANSSGNQASSPAGFPDYAWTINNGFIMGPTNLPTISYIAGVSGSVTLGLSVFNASGCSTNTSINVPIVTGFSVHTNLTFTNAIITVTMGIAFDGTNYWDCSGNSPSGIRLGRYTSSGLPIATYSPGLDFRSIFTKADGTVLARAYNTNVIYQQTSPGVFANSGISLTNGTLDPQSSVVLNGAGTEYDATSGGVVSRWSTNGSYLGSIKLQGFGSVSGETTSPQSRGLAAFGNVWLTYNGGGVVSAWDFSGNRVFQTVLPGAGTSFDSDYSFSYCNGKVFIVDVAGGKWRGYDISGGASVAVLSAEPSAAWNSDVTNKIMGTGSLPRVDLISVTGSTPTLAQLRSYQSVMVYSDGSFNDSVALGNVLADYIDQGGGVVLQTFSFYSGAGLGILGRATNGYLPFTTSSYASPGGLTLVKDSPLHPLLDGVNAFNGGTSSYQNSSISIAAGATLVGHWSNGQPLVGAKDIAPGRSAGLNFFPPSSDVRSDFWVSSTDGARLMADALLWSGRIPPTIISAPADQVVAAGGTATFSVVAAGTPPLAYQWRMNGTNIPAATNSTLSFTAGTGDMGYYSVVVSNLYGQTFSVNVTLSPQLHFLPPVLFAGDSLPLFLANSDGSLVASNRAARVQIYASTNLALPFDQWMPLTNPVIPNSGLLQVNGLTATNQASRFFRAREIP